MSPIMATWCGLSPRVCFGNIYVYLPPKPIRGVISMCTTATNFPSRSMLLHTSCSISLKCAQLRCQFAPYGLMREFVLCSSAFPHANTFQ